MKRLGLIIILLGMLGAEGLFAAPAAPIPMQVSQPDGTTFTVYAKGDEYANWTETADGYSVVKAGDTWYYAVDDGSGQLVAGNIPVGSLSGAQKQLLPKHLAPEAALEEVERTLIKISRSDSASGDAPDLPQTISHTQYVLTILVNYANIAFTYSDASFQSLIYGATNSVKHFYLENSYNGFNIMPAAESFGTANDGIVRISRPGNHPNQGGNGTTSRTQARAIVNAVDSFVNFASFDSNGDGYISPDELSIVIIVAGYETSYGGTANALTPNVWGHQYFFATPLTLDGKDLQPYTMFGERHATSVANSHQATIGIMAHELGHLMLGLPDLYDTDSSSYGIGIWSLMAGGSWNRLSGYSGESPAHMDAWSKVATGFTLAEAIDSDQNGVSIAQAETDEVAKRLWIDKYKINEYFLLENRQKTGYDAGLPGDGLLIWHVDETRTGNSNESRKLVDLEEADGLNQLDLLTSSGNGGDPYPGTTGNTTFNDLSNPNSRRYSGASTNVSVSSISASSANMTANIATSDFITGDHVRYDEFAGLPFGYNQLTNWAGLRALNDTAHQSFDGVEVYVHDPLGATIDINYYSSMSGGTPSGLIHSQTGFVAVPGWNRLLLTTPQSFPTGVERGVVLRIANNSDTHSLPYDGRGPASGRSYYSSTGVGTFNAFCPSWCGDLNLAVLLSTNSPPIFTPAANIARQQGSPAGVAVAVGTVGDSDTLPAALTVTQIAGGTADGITVSGISNSNGNITANVAASCAATSGTVRFQVADASLSNTGDLQVDVVANTQPTLSYGARTLNYLASGTHAAATGPSDNGSVSSVVVHDTGSYSGSSSVNSAGLVSFSNAQPAGTHTITIRAADNCGSVRDADFQLQVDALVPGAPTMGSATAGNTSAMVSFTAPVSNGGAAIDSYTVTSNPGNHTGIGLASPINITGLSNGLAYTFTVTATNSVGTGPASAASNPVIPVAEQAITFANPGDQDFGTTPMLSASASSGLTVTFSSNSNSVCSITPDGLLSFVTTGNCSIDADQQGNAAFLPASTITQSFTVNAVVPAAPLIGVAVAGDEEATVNFTAPGFNGGSAISSYTVTSNPGNLTGVAGSSPIIVEGLSNGQAYTFTVTATNTVGTGPASSPSNEVTPVSSQSIEFDNPGAQAFGSTPTLTATASSGLTVVFSSNSNAVCTITPEGLLNFVAVGSCSIDADQAGDEGYLPAPTITHSFVVEAVVPAAPVIGVATAGNAEATVTFTPPGFDGGAAIDSYTVTSNPGGHTAEAAASPITVVGLSNGQAYTFTVTAENSAGPGPASDPSNEVTPKAPPAEEVFKDGFE